MAKSTSSDPSTENRGEILDDDMGLLDTDLAEGDEWDDSLDETTPPPKKKKGGMFNVLIILIGVLVFVGILYSNLAMTPQGGVAPPIATSTPPQDTPTSETPIATPTEQPKPSATVPVDTQATQTGPLTPMPNFDEATTVPASDIPTGSTALTIPGANIVPPVVTLTPDDSAPLEDDEKVTGNNDAIAASVPTANPSDANDDASKIMPNDDMSREFTTEKIETDMATTSSVPVVSVNATSNMTSSSVDAAKIKELTDQVKILSERIAILEQELKDSGTPPQKTSVIQNESSNDPSDKTDSSDASVRTDNAPAPKPDMSRPRSTPKVNYVLRGVSGDTAYIARSVTSPVIRIQVGDTVDGMGTIQDIRMNGSGQWTVVTTGGTIKSR